MRPPRTVEAFDVQEIATIVAKWLEEVSGSDHRRKTDAQRRSLDHCPEHRENLPLGSC